MTFSIISGVAAPAGAATIDLSTVTPLLPAAGSYKTFKDRLGTALSAAQEVKVRNAWRGLYMNGLLSIIDQMCGGLASEADSLLNWISSNYATTKPGSTADPTWDATNGWTFDGVNDWLDNNFNPSTAGGHYALNSASISVLVTDTGANATAYAIGVQGASPYARLLARSGTVNGRLNDATSMANSNNSVGAGLWTINRTGANKVRLLRNGVLILEEAAHASVQMPAAEFAIARDNTTYFGGKVKAWAIGGGLTTGQELAIADAMLALA